MALVEQKILLETDPAKARALGRAASSIYLGLENYRNNWKRLGFTDADFANGGSDRFIDATIAWGDVGAIQKRIRATRTRARRTSASSRSTRPACRCPT